MKEPKKGLSISDLISIGVFTALYFVLAAIATFASGAIIPGWSNVILPGLCALISGCVFMLLACKVQKFGAITIMGVVMGLFFFASGHFVLSFAANMVCGLLADLAALPSHYKNRKILLASYIVFSYGMLGPVLPLWFMKSAYIANLEGRGKDAAYIEQLFANMNTASFIICLVFTFVCAFLGGLFGLKMLKKHFEKAGIV